MTDAWPTMFDATLLKFRVAKDRSHFFLEVQSQGHPSIGIRLPLSFGPELVEQLQGMMAIAGVPYDPNPRGNPKAN